jgi:predicted transcriptional regulator
VGQLKIQIRFFMKVIRLKCSGGEGLQAMFALISADILIGTLDVEEAFLDEQCLISGN